MFLTYFVAVYILLQSYRQIIFFTNIMTNHTLRLQAFVKLGEFFEEFCEYTNNNSNIGSKNEEWLTQFAELVAAAKHHNGWFTQENILFAIENWQKLLTKKQLENWLNRYNVNLNKEKTVALIMAGNIPFVGFHDFLAVLLTGNKALIKLSSNDKVLLPFISKYLIHQEPSLSNQIVFTEGKLEGFDAVIATGSDNTARYFEHYFSKKPHIIRKNRNSVAILTGKETNEQLEALGEDIFRYYGLGCRSVSKLFVPKGYKFDPFFEAIYKYNPIINQAKYANNYDYNKAVYLMSEFKILENGFLMLKKDEQYASPIATLFYESYDSLEVLTQKLTVTDKEKLQCIVSHKIIDAEISFGETQKPKLHEYADNVDTVDFLLKT